MRRHLQSVFDPHAAGAQSVLDLTWVMFIGAAVILLLVVVLTFYAIVARPERARWLAGAPAIVLGGIVLPVVVLSALLVYGLVITGGANAQATDAVRIAVSGERWWWRVRYLDASGNTLFDTANEIRIPVGKPVQLALTSPDVIHSFWVPKLAGKLDMIPGHVNRLQVQADQPGVFRGQCAEYCGGPHAMMAFYVVAVTPEEYAAWADSQARPAVEPQTDWLRSGRDIFMSSGCMVCHRIRGTQAMGSFGPDLTHIGSRLSIAAGNFANHRGTLAGWIAASQHLKPGNRMPSFTDFRGQQLRALAEYLESLK
jgi:cytochrome c oxidase subunit II